MSNFANSTIRTDMATIADLLSFDTYRDTLVEIIQEAETPLTIGIFGSWGSGKTSLLLMLEDQLKPEMTPIIFNAWQYSKEDALWRALMSRVLEALRPTTLKPNAERSKRLDDLQAALYREVDREELGGFTLDWSQIAKGGLKGALKFGLSYIPGINLVDDMVAAAGEETKTWAKDILDAFQREKTRIHVDHVKFIEQFQREFQTLVDDYVKETNSKFIVFVDDLDRCLPEKAIDVLEAIKVFLEAKGCVFVIAVDANVIIEGIRVKYRDFALRDGETSKLPITGDDYLEKIIQLPFYLPPVPHDDMVNFIKEQVKDLPKDCAEIFALGMEANPRKIKRTLNVFWMHNSVASRRVELSGKIHPVRLAKVVVIQSRYPDLYRDWVNAPLLLRDLERFFTSQATRSQQQNIAEQNEVTQSGSSLEVDQIQTGSGQPTGRLVEKWSTNRYLRRMLRYGADDPDMNFMDLDQSDLENYIYLTSTSVATDTQDEYGEQRTWDDLLSDDPTLIESAVGRITEDEKQDFVSRLIEVIGDRSRVENEPLSAGSSLAYLGDPRFNPDRWFLPNEPLLGFVAIKSGPFMMGSNPNQDKFAQENEQPQYELLLPMFYISRYPVTIAQYNAFVQDSDYEPHENSLNSDLNYHNNNYPATFIRWLDAIAYCQWLETKLNDKTVVPERLSKLLVYEGWKVTLPSEAEWEKAARGNDGRIFPWGNEFDKNQANIDNYGVRFATAVGCYPGGTSPNGLFDMSGNVLEWTRSLWGAFGEKPTYLYPYKADDGREQMESDLGRVMRGGSYAEPPENGRCAWRGYAMPGDAGGAMGFRVAITPPLDPGDFGSDTSR